MIKQLRKEGAEILNIEFTPQAGWPDLHVDHPLFHGWIELKMPKGRLDERQRLIQERLRRTGANVITLTLTQHGALRLDPPGEILQGWTNGLLSLVAGYLST